MVRSIAVPIALVCGLALSLWQPREARAGRPNIVVILSDDMGYSDLGCYGGEIRTPNLDALAAGGLRFTQFYNGARCCPTRAALLTGLHCHQAGMGHMTEDRGSDAYRGVLNRRCFTIAEVLQPAGYRTYMVGKWHLTGQADPAGDKSCYPLQRGFEKFYGTIFGCGSFYDPASLCRQNTFISPEHDAEYRPESYYYTDALSDNAVRYLQQHAQESPDKPFFLYVAYTAAHWPMHARDKDIARYQGAYDQGYQPVRAARLARLKELGLVASDAEMVPTARDWEQVKDKAWEARSMEVYAAMVDVMDAGIGRLVAQLKASGQLENTLLVFLQDNGACAELTGRSANAPAPPGLTALAADQLQPRPLPPMQTRDGQWVRTGPGVMPGPKDTFVAYGPGWANVSNTPFREYKHWTHEGGISTPLVVHWPSGIAGPRRGQLESQPSHLIDIMATCLDVAGASYPARRDGQQIPAPAGVSLRGAFEGRPLDRPQPLFWEHEGNRAVRQGDWKLVGKNKHPWELYDIAHDRAELHDLAAAETARVSALSALYDAWAERVGVRPWTGEP